MKRKKVTIILEIVGVGCCVIAAIIPVAAGFGALPRTLFYFDLAVGFAASGLVIVIVLCIMNKRDRGSIKPVENKGEYDEK